MNKYAKLAMSHWKRTDPARYEAIEDPQTFFRDLGEQAEAEIQTLATRLAGPDQPGEEYLEKVGRLNMARLQAEEAVLAQLILIEEPQASETPAGDQVSEAMRAVHEALFEEDDEPTA
ncbi:MAG: TnpV protein [Solirubrobacteraceae bacterium]